ncbi:MAG: TIM barrel protein [Verrucomicrobiota bacterium]
MKPIVYLLSVLVLPTLSPAVDSLYPLDNAFNGRDSSASERAALLKELGYPGTVTEQKTYTKEWGEALADAGLEVEATYIILRPTKKGIPVPKDVATHLAEFEGTETDVWVTVGKPRKFDVSEEQVVEAISEVADIARANGLRTVVYPHYSFVTDTNARVLQIAQAIDREDLGVAFSLCHFLKQEDPSELEVTLEAAKQHLMAVQINGADENGKETGDWSRLILPLGEGDFDVMRVLETLESIGYDGPITLQCFGIQSPPEDHLAKSMAEWNTMLAE